MSSKERHSKQEKMMAAAVEAFGDAALMMSQEELADFWAQHPEGGEEIAALPKREALDLGKKDAIPMEERPFAFDTTILAEAGDEPDMISKVRKLCATQLSYRKAKLRYDIFAQEAVLFLGAQQLRKSIGGLDESKVIRWVMECLQTYANLREIEAAFAKQMQEWGIAFEMERDTKAITARVCVGEEAVRDAGGVIRKRKKYIMEGFNLASPRSVVAGAVERLVHACSGSTPDGHLPFLEG